MISSSCPLCGLTGCAAPCAEAEAVAPDVVARVRRAVEAGLPTRTVAHPLRVRWTIRADEWAAADLPLGTVYVGYGAGWSNPFQGQNQPHDEAVDRYREWLLACWCSLTVACHADVLLELVNESASSPGVVPSVTRAPVGSTPAR